MICLELMNLTGHGYNVASIMYILVNVARIVIISMCARSMVKMINKSMKRHADKQRSAIAATPAAAAAAAGGGVKITADPKLATAKKTILSALFICMTVAGATSASLTFSLVTEYGTNNPIVFLAMPLAFGPMIILSFRIQLHSRRNKATPAQPLPSQSPTSGGYTWADTNTVTCSGYAASGGGRKGTTTGSSRPDTNTTTCGGTAAAPGGGRKLTITGGRRVLPTEEPGGRDRETGDWRIENIAEDPTASCFES